MSLQFGEYELDRERRQLLRSGRPVPLEPKAYELLSLLVERRPRALSRAQIRDVVWPGVFISESTLGVAVNAIRQALGDDARQPRFIRTVHGFGYAFCGEAEGEEALGHEEAVKPLEPRSPYPGLSSFTEEDAEVFFGREAEVEALWERLRRGRLLALIGPSGAGKTSFVRAGVIPARPEGWRAIVSVPGRSPLNGLAQALAPEVAGDAEAVKELLRFEDPDAVVAMLRRWRQGDADALLVVDQFEELFTLNPPEAQERFTELVGRLVGEANVHVLLSLRDDFLMRCDGHEALRPVFGELTPLSPLSHDGLRRALTEPARKEGFGFEDEALVEEMLESVEGVRGALPLLAFAVSRLWEKRDRDRRLLTRVAYEEIGGVAGALAQHAEQTLERIGPDREPIVRELFRNLVTAQQTRAAADREELLSVLPNPDTGAPVLDALIDARLLTSYEATDPAPSSRGAQPGISDEGSAVGTQTAHRIEIVHESLLRAWPRLVRWQAQDEEGALLRDQLKQAAHLWEEKGRPDDLLWTGTSEREFELWRERYLGRLTALEDDFSHAMVERARRRKRLRRLVTASVVAAALLVASVTGALWRRSDTARLQAEAEVRQREAAQILSLGRLRLEGHPTAALAYALASLERADNEPARRFAVQALWKGPMAHVISDAIIPALPAWGPDGQWLAVGGVGGLLLLDRDGGQHRLHEGAEAFPVCFSADGSRLVTREAPNALHLWALPGLERLETWTSPSVGDEYADVDLLGQRLLISEWDKAAPADRPLVVRELSIDGGPERVLGRWPSGEPMGDWLVSIEDGRILQRRLNALEAPPRVVGRHDGDVSLRVWPSTDRIVTSDATGEIRVWDAEAGQLERSFRSPTDARNLAWPARRYLAAAPGGLALLPRSFYVFDLEAPQGADPLALLNDEIEVSNLMTFHPDGHLFTSGHFPHGVLLWNLATRRSVVLRGQKGLFGTVSFTPNGRLVSTSDEGVVRLWPLWTEPDGPVRELRSRPGRESLGGGLDVSPDGRFAVVVERWAGQVIVVPLDGSGGTVHDVSRVIPDASEVMPSLGGAGLAPDGHRVAISCYGERPEAAAILILDLKTGSASWLRAEDAAGACIFNSPGVGPAQIPHWLPDGRLVSEGALGLRLWDLGDGSSRPLRACRDMVFPPYMAATPDSNTILTLIEPRPAPGESSVLTAFDLATHTSREITGHGNRVSAFTLDPTGTILVTGDLDGLVRVGPLSGGEPHLLYGHSRLITDLAVSPDGQWIASASNDETIRLWPMPEVSEAPLHALPREELLARLRAFTNLRVAPDEGSETGYRVEAGPFPGWATTPKW